MKRILIIGIVMWAVVATLANAAAFLENGSAARADGIGRAVTALGDDLDAYYYNPAGYALQKNAKINTMYSREIDVFNVYYLGYGTRLGGGFGAANLYMARLDDIPETEYVNGEIRDTGRTFEYSSKALFLSYGVRLIDTPWAGEGWLRKTSLGINVKYLNEILYQNQAGGIGMDVGLLSVFGDLRVGAMAHNLIEPVMIWDTDSQHKDIVGRSFTFGIAYTGFEKFLLCADLLLASHHFDLSYGVEYQLLSSLALRAGAMPTAFTLGLGLRYVQWNFDYAFIKSHETVIDDTHKFSMGFMFGNDEDRLEAGASIQEPLAPQEEQPRTPEEAPAVPAAEPAVPEQQTAVPEVQERVADPGPVSVLTLGEKTVMITDGRLKCLYRVMNTGDAPLEVRAVVTVRAANGEVAARSPAQVVVAVPQEEAIISNFFSASMFPAGAYTVEAAIEPAGSPGLYTQDTIVTQ